MKILTKTLLKVTLDEEMPHTCPTDRQDDEGPRNGNPRHRARPNTVITDTAGPTQNDAPRDRASTSTTGIKGADNAAMQSWFALPQKNVLDRQRWATRQDQHTSITTRTETAPTTTTDANTASAH